MPRVMISFVGAILFSVLFLFALKSTIEVRNVSMSSDDNLRVIDFVRLKKEQQLTKKERVKPKKPESKKKPIKPKVNIPKPKQPKVAARIMEPLNLDIPVNLSATSALGDAMVSGYSDRTISTNVIPLVRINPVYPRRAKVMKKEGYVALEFTITEFGSVKDIEIVESQPEKIFDSAAKRALTKWKFRPKVENNQALEQRAMVKINFKLDQ